MDRTMMARILTASIGAAALVAAMALAAPAQATQIDFDGAVHDFGALLTPQAINFDETTATGATPVTVTIDGTDYDHFDYIYSFTVSAPNTKVEVSAGAAGATLFSETHTVFYDSDPSGRPLFTHGDPNEVSFPTNTNLIDIGDFSGFLAGGSGGSGASASLASLAVGTTYYLRIFGVLPTGGDGHFTATLQTAVLAAATPVPGTLILFLTAIGGLALTGWRRQQFSLR
jgi:hypothetical protein